MSPTVLLLALSLSVASATLPPPAVWLPKGTNAAGLWELTQHGEVFYLPEHNAHRFRALMLTQSPETCDAMEAAMFDVRKYPQRWTKMTDVKVLSETEDRVQYTFELDMMFSPSIQGIVQRERKHRVHFLSPENARSSYSWRMKPYGKHCSMMYAMQQPPGERSSFVKLVKKMESGIGDAAEFAGALATSRGYTGEPKPTRSVGLSPRAISAYQALSAAGTVVRAVTRKNTGMVFQARRQIAVPIDAVIERVESRKKYGERIDFFDEVTEESPTKTEWELEYFGADVDFITTATMERAADGTYTRTETISGGDLKRGYWRLTLTPLPGGTAVDLEVDVDVREGSSILRALARQDQTLENANGAQFALEFMRVFAAGKMLPAVSSTTRIADTLTSVPNPRAVRAP